MTLAVAGALLFKSFARLTSVRPGFDPERVLSLKVFLTPPRYRTVASGKQYVRSSLERLAAIPGVESVAAVSQLPLGDPSSGAAVRNRGPGRRSRRPAVRGISRRQRRLFRDPSHPARAGACAHRGRPRGQPARRRRQRGVGADVLAERGSDRPAHPVGHRHPAVRRAVAHGGRRGGGRQEQRPRQAGAAGDLRPVHAAHVHLAALEQLRRAHARRAAVVRARDSPGADEDRPDAADLSGGVARHGDLAVGRGAAVSHRARRRLRRAGARRCARSASTAPSATGSRSGRARSACAWRSAPPAAPSC